jgi:hypothetical protein
VVLSYHPENPPRPAQSLGALLAGAARARAGSISASRQRQSGRCPAWWFPGFSTTGCRQAWPFWQPPGQSQTAIPTSNLFVAPISNNGLLGKYYPNGNWQEPSAFTQVDPWIHFYFQNQPLNRPYTVEWTGRIKITRPGSYRFCLESIDESLLFIDDASDINETTPNEIQEGKVSLSAGFHTIRLRCADRCGYSLINLYWTHPDAEQEIIPQDLLYLL